MLLILFEGGGTLFTGIAQKGKISRLGTEESIVESLINLDCSYRAGM